MFALRSPKVIHLLPGEHGEILGRLEMGWEKAVCWSTKAAISLKRVKNKIEEKLLWGAYRKSPTLFRIVPSVTRTTSPSPRLGFTTPTKTLIAIISGTAKAMHFKFSMHIQKLSWHSYIRRIVRYLCDSTDFLLNFHIFSRKTASLLFLN